MGRMELMAKQKRERDARKAAKKAASKKSGITGGQGGKKSRYQTKRAEPLTKPNKSIVKQSRAKAKKRGAGVKRRK